MAELMLSSGSYNEIAPRPGSAIQIGAGIKLQCLDTYTDICSTHWRLRFHCGDYLNLISKAAPFLPVLKLA